MDTRERRRRQRRSARLGGALALGLAGLLGVLVMLGAGCGGDAEGGGAGGGDGATGPADSAVGDLVLGADALPVEAGAGDGRDDDTTPCEGPDCDGDGIPDEADPFPQDPDRPGVAQLEAVYAHSATTLYKLDVKTYELETIGDFGWPADEPDPEMTDIAIDRWGVLYGISFRSLFVCHPETAACTALALLPNISSNGLTFAPGAGFGEEADVLLAVTQFGDWYRLDRDGATVRSTELGRYNGYCSSGDAYAVADAGDSTGTFASVKRFVLGCREGTDRIVRLDATSGDVLDVVAELGDYAKIWGLAGWNQYAFAFDADTGDVLAVNVVTGTWERIVETDPPVTWWGAGTRTRF